MLNRLTTILNEGEPGPSLRDEYSPDRNPQVRLFLLAVLLIAPLLVIGAKVAYLKTVQAEAFIAGFETTVRESFQPIAATDGRIVVGTTVLAQDVPRYQLKLHYRWLEEPADGLWLRRRARMRLTDSERRDRERIEAAQNEVLAEREQMWSRLASVLEISHRSKDFIAIMESAQTRMRSLLGIPDDYEVLLLQGGAPDL